MELLLQGITELSICLRLSCHLYCWQCLHLAWGATLAQLLPMTGSKRFTNWYLQKQLHQYIRISLRCLYESTTHEVLWFAQTTWPTWNYKLRLYQSRTHEGLLFVQTIPATYLFNHKPSLFEGEQNPWGSLICANNSTNIILLAFAVCRRAVHMRVCALVKTQWGR